MRRRGKAPRLNWKEKRWRKDALNSVEEIKEKKFTGRGRAKNVKKRKEGRKEQDMRRTKRELCKNIENLKRKDFDMQGKSRVRRARILKNEK